MPAVERKSLPQSLSAVASKGRRFFSREIAGNDAHSRPSTALRTSALNLNEALEQAWASSASPYCLSNHLLSPQPSVSSQIHSWDARRRSSNTTTASTSSIVCTQEAPQRRRKSLFSKKPRSDQLADDPIQEDSHSFAGHFVDPFAREARNDSSAAAAKASSQGFADQQHDTLPSNRNSQRIWTQQQQKKEALDRISDLICLSVEHQTQLPRSQIGASSPRFPSASPNMPDSAFFYPIEPPPSPTSMVSSSNSSQRRASIIAFPSRIDSERGLRLNMSGDSESTQSGSSTVSPSLSASSTQADTTLRECFNDAPYHSGGNHRSYDAVWSPKAEARELPVEHFQLLLPSSMKRPPSKTMESDASKKSNASLRAELGHGSERVLRSTRDRGSASSSQNSFDWLLMEEIRRPSQPPPPLRPSRNPMRNRSKSLCSATVASRSSSPPPPMPSLPGASPPHFAPVVNATGLVGPCDLTPVHTPPRSRPVSANRQQARARCDSLTSAASSASLRAASFHTPTFGSNSWTTLPVS